MISTAYRSAMTVPTIMSGFRKSGVFPLDPAVIHVEVPTISTSSSEKTVCRKDRKDNRAVKILFKEKIEEFQNLKSSITEKPKRKRFVPPFGAAITEDQFLKEKEQNNMLPKPAKPPQKRKQTKSFTPPFTDTQSSQLESNTSADCTLNQTKKKKSSEKTKTPDAAETNANEQKKSKVASKGKGPMKSSKGKALMKKKQKPAEIIEGTSQAEDSGENCIVCGRWEPVNLNLHLAIKFVEWVQCSSCRKWVHQTFCTKFQPLNDDHTFNCQM